MVKTQKKKASFFDAASAKDGVEYRTAKMWQLIMAPASSGCNICFYLLMGFASYVGSQSYGIATMVVGIILTASRIFDAVTDSLVAIVFEKFPAKHGKVRPFLYIGWLIEAVAALALFRWAAGKYSGVTGVVVFTLIYLLYIIGYTVNNVANGVMGAVLTNNPSQRPMLGFVSMMYSYGVPIIFNNITAFVILPRYNNVYSQEMLAEMCVMYILFGLVFAIISGIGVASADNEEMYETASIGKKQKVSLKQMWEVLSKNKDVQRYIVTCATDKFAQTTATQSVIITLLNGVLIGSYAATQTVNNFSIIIGLVCAFTIGVLITRIGARKATIMWSWASIGINVVMIIFCCILGPMGMSKIGNIGSGPFILYCILTMAVTATKMGLTTAANTMKPDVVDGEAVRSGNFLPSVVSGVYSLIDKCMSSICSTVAALAITLIGYKNTVPQMGDKVTTGVFVLAIFLSFGLPILGWICNLVAMRKYTLTKERMVEVQKELAERRK